MPGVPPPFLTSHGTTFLTETMLVSVPKMAGHFPQVHSVLCACVPFAWSHLTAHSPPLLPFCGGGSQGLEFTKQAHPQPLFSFLVFAQGHIRSSLYFITPPYPRLAFIQFITIWNSPECLFTGLLQFSLLDYKIHKDRWLVCLICCEISWFLDFHSGSTQYKLKYLLYKWIKFQAVVNHTCNPSYSGGRGRKITVWGQLQAKAVDSI
jgi:hypothetical protein